jgi:hypothetical protein
MKPLQNLNVLKRIGEEKKAEWAHHYIKVGLDGKRMNGFIFRCNLHRIYFFLSSGRKSSRRISRTILCR